MIDSREELARTLGQSGIFDEEAEARLRTLDELARAEAMDIARMIARVFATEDGKRLLHYWTKIYITRPIVRPGEDAYAQGIREGQAGVMRDLYLNLEIARKGA